MCEEPSRESGEGQRDDRVPLLHTVARTPSFALESLMETAPRSLWAWTRDMPGCWAAVGAALRGIAPRGLPQPLLSLWFIDLQACRQSWRGNAPASPRQTRVVEAGLLPRMCGLLVSVIVSGLPAASCPSQNGHAMAWDWKVRWDGGRAPRAGGGAAASWPAASVESCFWTGGVAGSG